MGYDPRLLTKEFFDSLPDDATFEYSAPSSVYKDHPDSMVVDEYDNRLERGKYTTSQIKRLRERNERYQL